MVASIINPLNSPPLSALVTPQTAKIRNRNYGKCFEKLKHFLIFGKIQIYAGWGIYRSL